jgi:ParB-like chromosome segregation protein Spo0J
MSEIEPGLENDHPVERPVREGLPPNYRMRADTHYVEQLDADHPSPVRVIEARSIDVRGDEPRVSAPFVESIRRHGILQPLLVQPRGNRFRLIAGRKRLVAAHAAGLREVPCLVQRVDEDQANVLAEAANTPAGDGPAPTVAPTGAETAALHATDQLAQTLMALATSANLLSGGSALTNAVAADLVKAEAARALQLLTAQRVLGNEVLVSRVRVPVRTVVDRAMQVTAPERRLRSTDVRVSMEGVRDASVRGDEELLAAAVAGLVMATAGLVGERGGPATLSVTAKQDRVSFACSQSSLSVPESWIERTFDAAWPSATIPAGTLALMQAAKRIAELHGGQAQAASLGDGTSFTLVLPLVAREM